jgi:hypothetical protein
LTLIKADGHLNVQDGEGCALKVNAGWNSSHFRFAQSFSIVMPARVAGIHGLPE